MSIIGKLFEVVIDVVEIPVGVATDAISLAACGETVKATEKKIEKLKKDLIKL